MFDEVVSNPHTAACPASISENVYPGRGQYSVPSMPQQIASPSVVKAQEKELADATFVNLISQSNELVQAVPKTGWLGFVQVECPKVVTHRSFTLQSESVAQSETNG